MTPIERQIAALTAAINGQPFEAADMKAAVLTLGVFAEAPDLFRAVLKLHRAAPLLAAVFKEFPEATFGQIENRT